MKNFAVFDIEADKWVNFVVMGFFDGVEYRTFDSPRALIVHLNQKKFDGWRVYAHFGGKYDFLFILEDLFAETSDVSILPRNGRIVTMTARMRNAVIHFVDSFALLPASLKNLTRAFKVEHVKGEYDFSQGVVLNPDLLVYLESDVLGLREVLEKFAAIPFNDTVKYTIGSQALHVYKTYFAPPDLQAIPMDYEDAIRAHFYSGGRVEVYKGRGAAVHTYDVNSLYPFVMLNEMPMGEVNETTTYHPGKIGFYHVTITSTPDFYIPPYLVRTPEKNYFVNGAGDYYLSSATLDYLSANYGVRFTVKWGMVFEGKARIFDGFIQHYYSIKQTSDDPTLVLLAKLFLNNLYGKLGQSRVTETITGYKSSLQSFNVDDDLWRFGLVAVESFSRSRYILPHLAAYITELARLEHWKYLQVDPGAVFYGDTDSIYTSSRALDQFVGPEIGRLKFEGTYEGIFLLPKTYALRNADEGDVISFKGFDAKKFTFGHFEEALRGGTVLRERRERMLSFREAMRRKAPVKREVGAFLKLCDIDKETDPRSNDKREVIASDAFDFDTRAHYIQTVSQIEGNTDV